MLPQIPAQEGQDATVNQLLTRAQAGDRTAEAHLCMRCIPAIRAFARRRLRSADVIAELVQDVLLVFVEAVRRGAVEDPARVGGFVLGICRNLAHDRVKQRERRAALWDQYSADLVRVAASDEPTFPSYESMHLEDCISQLSARARDVLRLSFGESKSHLEIAAALSTTEANARVLRHRTLHTLRDCMSKRISWEAA